MTAKLSLFRASERRVRAVGLVAFASVFMWAGVASATKCAQPKEHEALNTRVLQTELMVAALSCSNQPLYNAFVTKFQKQLVDNGQSLRRFYEREHGARGATQLNAMVTRIANEASQVSNDQHIGFCYQASILFSQALKTDPRDFQTLLDKPMLRGRHGIAPCGTTKQAEVQKPIAGFGAAVDRMFK